jgi:hypothetical protein
MIPTPCIEVQTYSEDRPSVPAWFAEVVLIAHYLTQQGVLEALTHQVRKVARTLWAVRGHRLPRAPLWLRHQWGTHAPRIFYPSDALRHALYGPVRTV